MVMTDERRPPARVRVGGTERVPRSGSGSPSGTSVGSSGGRRPDPPLAGQRAGVLTADQAAELLGVSPDTLEMWIMRFGYPTPKASHGSGPFYACDELVALRDALASELSVVTAVRRAQRVAGAGAYD